MGSKLGVVKSRRELLQERGMIGKVLENEVPTVPEELMDVRWI